MSEFPLSASVRAGDWLIVSGQLGFDGDELAEGVAAQTRHAVLNLRSALQAAGATLKDVVKTTVFLTSMDDYALMNAEYARSFETPYPGRSAIAVSALPCGGLVEIEAWAYVGIASVSHV